MTQDVGLPVRDFLYTLDQLAYLLEVNETYVKNNLIFFTGRSVGAPDRDRIVAINIAPDGKVPQWRVTEKHFKRWLRFKGYHVYDRGYVR